MLLVLYRAQSVLNVERIKRNSFDETRSLNTLEALIDLRSFDETNKRDNPVRCAARNRAFNPRLLETKRVTLFGFFFLRMSTIARIPARLRASKRIGRAEKSVQNTDSYYYDAEARRRRSSAPRFFFFSVRSRGKFISHATPCARRVRSRKLTGRRASPASVNLTPRVPLREREPHVARIVTCFLTSATAVVIVVRVAVSPATVESN